MRWDLVRRENVGAECQMPAQVAIRIEHARARGQGANQDDNEKKILKAGKQTAAHAGILHKKSDAHGVALLDSMKLLFSEVVTQLAPDGGMSQAAERLGLDLADALASYAHFSPNFLERICLPIEQAIAKLEYPNFARR